MNRRAQSNFGATTKEKQKLSSKIKFGVLAIVAALLFVLPSAFGKASVSAAPILSNGQGDVCWLGTNAGNTNTGNANGSVPPVLIRVGQEFDVLARLQDSFHLPLVVQAAAYSQTGVPPVTGAAGYFGPPLAPGNYMVGVLLNPFDDPDVIPFYLSASIDSQTGEAKIVDRIEDHSISNLTFRFPFLERNGVAWTWPSILNVIDFFGVATENRISPVDTVNALDVLTELAGGGGDLDVGGGAIGNAGYVYNSDIQEFFVNSAVTATDETVAPAL